MLTVGVRGRTEAEDGSFSDLGCSAHVRPLITKALLVTGYMFSREYQKNHEVDRSTGYMNRRCCAFLHSLCHDLPRKIISARG